MRANKRAQFTGSERMLPNGYRVPVRAVRRKAGWLNAMLADWDLLVLLVLILADVRLFKGSAVASFTLFELFAWGYCAPFVIGHALQSRRLTPSLSAPFVYALGLYLIWLLIASFAALIFRGHSDVLQQAKNIMPAMPLVCFVLIRLKQPETVARLANLYVLYCIAACALALLQFKTGGPYLRPPDENDQYKLDFTGELVSNVVVGFSATPNELAVAVLPGLMFSAIKLVYELRENRHPRLITLVCCILTGTVLILSASRGAVVWFALGFAFLIAPTRRGRSFLLKLALVVGLITLMVFYGLHFAAEGTTIVEDTLKARYLLWKTSVAAMVDDPYVALLGDGMNYVRTSSWQAVGWEFPDAHNGWIDQVLFFGFPALVFYLSIWQRFFGITDTPARSSLACPLSRVLLDGIRGSVLALMGLSFFEPVAHAVLPVSQLFFLMSCGVWLSLNSHENLEN